MDRSVVDGAPGEVNVKDIDTADFINNFFSSIGPKLARNYTDPWKFYGEIVDADCAPLRAEFDQVLQLCKDIKVCKSSGIEDIPTKAFKDSFRVLISQLVFLFNLSFSKGQFPDSWKRATIIPLYKEGDKTEVSNYRPVSLLPLPGKIIEKIAHTKMTIFFEDYKMLSDKQGGFRKGFSTTKSIADLTDDLFNNINEGLTSLAVFVDLRKAFDTVNHAILLDKLNHYGIRGVNLKWCTSYLEDRSQVTLANGIRSGAKSIACGVPQGLVLGPLFFIIYVNDMQSAVQEANSQLYADDTVIYASGQSPDQAANKLQPALNLFTVWCKVNKLSLNVSKTKQMNFGTRHKVKKASRTKLMMDNVALQIVPTYKYLGFMLDSTLSFSYHVKSVTNILMYKSVLLAKIRKFLTEDVTLRIYKSMILEYFDYGDVIYSSANQEGLKKLQRLQNKCLKICKGYNKRAGTDEIHIETKIQKLELRREDHINSFMYGRLENIDLVDTRKIRTRAHSAPLFKVKIPKLSAYKRSVEYAGATRWNDLPPCIRRLDNQDTFKAKQNQILLHSVTRQ